MHNNHKISQKRPLNIFNDWHCRIYLRKAIKKIKNVTILVDFICKVISSPVMLGIVTLFQLAAGAILGANISLAFPSKDYEKYNITELSNIIWSKLHDFTISFVLIAIIVTLIRAITDYYLTFQMQKKAIKIAKEQRSLPDTLWLHNYFTIYMPEIMNISNQVQQSFNDKCFDDVLIKKSITNLLEIARDMASLWDNSQKESYSSNIMLYAPTSTKVAGFIQRNWEQNSKFFDSHHPISAKNQISGILYVAGSANSSVKFYGDGEGQDNTPLILPICLENDLEKNKNLSKQSLPGAPEAFRRGNFHYSEDLLIEIEQWLTCEYWHLFTDEQAQEIYNYYRSDHSGRSLISIPITLPTNIEHNETGTKLTKGSSLGVLNVYSQNTKMLRGNASDYNEFCRPLISSLALCIAAYEIWTKLPSEDDVS